MPDAEDPKQGNNNDLRNAQFGGGLINADRVNAGRIGGDIVNNYNYYNEQLNQKIEINWHQVSSSLLNEHLRLTTNPLTMGEGITYRTEQVYVPLGLVERKKQSRRKEDVSPEKGSELYHETEIKQTFEPQQFLEQVLRDRQSPQSQGKRIAIIGEPGAGKTTLLQQIAKWVSKEIEQSVVIWVSLADLRSHELETYLLEVWLQAVARKAGHAEASNQLKDDFVTQFNQGLVWLMLDGVDEMQTQESNPLEEIERQIRMGALLQQSRIVISCRLNLWDNGINALESFDNYRTLDFSYPQQVEEFICKWFSSQSPAEMQTGQQLCVALREQGKERIRDLVKNPLRLTLLCFNWHLGEGNLPQTKAGLYEQFVADFYEWKKERFATTREQRMRLKKALGEMAREAIDKEAMRFRLRQEFVCEYLGEPDDTDSLFTLALRLGWLNKVGVEADNLRREVYAFFHPTFQEYFAASAINDWHYFLNHIPENPIHPNANYRVFDLQWRDVLFIWIGFLKNNYIEVIDALVSFEDRCKSWNNNLKTFYEHQAYIIALYCLMEISIDKTFKYITKQLAIYIYNVCGEKERHNYWSFLSNDIFLVLEQLYKKHILQKLFNLAASEINNVKIISELKKIVFVCKDITLHNHDQLILERQDILNIVAEIDKLIRTSEAGESVYYRISQYIELIEKNNLILINKLILILNEANPRHIKLKAIRALSLAADENLDAITAINQEIENSPDIIYLFYTTITLIQINPSNTEAFLSLYELLPQLHICMQMEACEFLIKNKGIVDDLFIDLIELIEKHPNDEVYYRACQALKNNVNVLHIGYSLLLISKLKNCLTDKVYKHNFFRYRDCYELLWYFSQKVPYKLFCEAWLK